MEQDLTNLPNYNSKLFLWTGNNGFSEASDLEVNGSVAKEFTLDSGLSAWGFYVTSSKTGKKVLFSFSHLEDEIYFFYGRDGNKELKIKIAND